MKTLIRNTSVNSLSLYFLSIILTGVIVKGGFLTYLIGGIALSIMNYTIRPVLSILSLPLNIVTLGLFSFFSNSIILYLLTVLVPNIKIVPFTLAGFSYSGFIVPSIHFGGILSFVAASFFLSLFYSYFEWLTKK